MNIKNCYYFFGIFMILTFFQPLSAEIDFIPKKNLQMVEGTSFLAMQGNFKSEELAGKMKKKKRKCIRKKKSRKRKD